MSVSGPYVIKGRTVRKHNRHLYLHALIIIITCAVSGGYGKELGRKRIFYGETINMQRVRGESCNIQNSEILGNIKALMIPFY